MRHVSTPAADAPAIDRRRFLAATGSAAATTAALASAWGVSSRAFGQAAPAEPPRRDRPNVLFVLVDDLGYPGVGRFGQEHVDTPHLDALADTGATFTHAYVTPQCTPTRATLLTGQHSARHRMWHVVGPYHYPHAKLIEPPYRENLSRETHTLPKAMRAAGYRTAMLGKWHLSTWADGNYNILFQPFIDAHGFDVAAPDYDQFQRNVGLGGSPDKGVAFLTDRAIDFTREAQADGVPWFCYLSHHPVHGPYKAPRELVRKYLDRGYPADKKARLNAHYLAMIDHVDAHVGRLLADLEASGQRDNTLVVFLSDNGGITRAQSNAPLRQGKGSPYEGGTRVPMIANWPGVIPRGRTCDARVHAVDVFPTLAEAAGATPDPAHTLDGLSLVPLMTGASDALGREALPFYMPLYDAAWGAAPCATLIEGDYKLLEFFGDYVDVENGMAYEPHGRVELYRLADDPGETRDLFDAEPERARGMLRRLYAWLGEMDAPMPTWNPAFDPDRPFADRQPGQHPSHAARGGRAAAG